MNWPGCAASVKLFTVDEISGLADGPRAGHRRDGAPTDRNGESPRSLGIRTARRSFQSRRHADLRTERPGYTCRRVSDHVVPFPRRLASSLAVDSLHPPPQNTSGSHLGLPADDLRNSAHTALHVSRPGDQPTK